MKDKNGDDVCFVFSKEETAYIEHLKKHLFHDNYTKPNMNDYKIASNNIGRLMKTSDLEKLYKEIKTQGGTEKQENLPLQKQQKPKNIHEGHRKRLRELFKNVNPTHLPEVQILELMLSYVQPQKDTNPLAHALLDTFGNFANVLNASVEDLKRVGGVGEIIAHFIHFCSKIPLMYNNSKTLYCTVLKNPNQFIDFFRSKVTFGNDEEFYYVCLDNKGNVLCFKSLGTGTSSKMYIDVRVLVQNILMFSTQNVVICHTHPNGTPYPSNEDKKFTANLYNTLEGINIKLFDHIIISPDGFYSLYLHNEDVFSSTRNLKYIYPNTPTLPSFNNNK